MCLLLYVIEVGLWGCVGLSFFLVFWMVMVCNVLLFGCGEAGRPSPFYVFESCMVFLVVVGAFIWV